MQQQVENHTVRQKKETFDKPIQNDLNYNSTLEERLKRLEQTKHIDFMGHVSYWFRISTNFDVSAIIAIFVLGIYFFFLFDYFIQNFGR